MRLLHCGDFHIGAGTLPSAVGALQQIGHIAVEREVDIVAFAGDAFNSRVPTPTYNRVWTEFTNHLQASGIELVAIPGNHDRPSTKGLAHTLEPFDTNSAHFTVIGRFPAYAHGEEANFVLLPWQNVSDMVSPVEMASMTIEEATALAEERILEQVEKAREGLGSPCILLAHIMVSTAEESSERHLVLGKAPVLDIHRLQGLGFDYLALGHVHKYQVFEPFEDGSGPAVYCGSPRQMDFSDEGDDKGVVIVDFDAQGHFSDYEFIPLDLPQFYTLEISAIDQDMAETLEALRSGVAAFSGADIFRVQVSGPGAALKTISDDAIADALDGRRLAYVLRRATDVERRRSQTLEAETLTPLEALDQYMETMMVGEDATAYRTHAEILMRGD